MIKKPLNNLKEEILSFTEIFKTAKEYVQLIGDFSKYKEFINNGLKSITDPIDLVKTFPEGNLESWNCVADYKPD